MGAFSELPSFLGKDLVDIATNLNYSKANILILKGDEDNLRIQFQDIYSNILSCVHNRDKRTPFAYAQDLVASWLFEDYLIDELLKSGLNITRAGADSGREILCSKNVSSNSDSLISFNGKNRLMEIMTDYTGYWVKNGIIHLRDSKYSKLRRSSSLFIGFSTKDKSYVLFDFLNEVDAEFIPYHYPYGGKPAYAIKIPSRELHKFEVSFVINDIKAKF